MVLSDLTQKISPKFDKEMKLIIRSTKFETVRIYFLSDVLLPWECDVNDFTSLLQLPIKVFRTCKTTFILSFVLNKVIKLRLLPKAGYGFRDFLVHNRPGSGFQTLSGSPIPQYWSIIPWALKGLCHEDIAISGHFCALLPKTYTK